MCQCLNIEDARARELYADLLVNKFAFFCMHRGLAESAKVRYNIAIFGNTRHPPFGRRGHIFICIIYGKLL